MIHKDLQITYNCNNIPDGIKDKTGFLFFFPLLHRYPGQEGRYELECHDRNTLANYLLEALRSRFGGG